MVSLLRHLDRDRFLPHLYLIYRSGPLLEEIPNDVVITSFEERSAGARLYLPGLNHRRRVRDMTRYLQEVKADVAYDRTFLMTLIAADAAWRAGVPNVSTVVTDPSLGFAPVAGRFAGVKRRLLHRLYSHSSCVLANSAGAARSAERFYELTTDSVRVHYNGLDLDAVADKSRRPVQDDWWHAESDRTVCRLVTAGRLNREKGFHVLIEALHAAQQQRPETEFRLAILGEGSAREDLSRQIAAHQLTEQIRLVGFQQNAPAWYKSADIFVLPSFLEGMPNVLLEAMATETCVISTDCPSGPAEILDHGTYGTLIPVNHVDRLADALLTESAALTTQTAIDRRAAAAQRVRERFSIQSAVEQLQDIFDELRKTPAT